MKSANPDAALIARWRDAIDDWETRASGATSSITGGGAVEILEGAFSDLMHGRSCLATGSGTSALAACLIGVGVQPGDNVLTSALDWTAATDAIRSIGASPVYVDIDPTTATIDPHSAASRYDRRTSAVVATHLFGIPADVPALRAGLPDSLPIVEDCAQAFGALLGGQPVGTLGDAAAFSFGPGKLIDAGEGGITVFADEMAWERAVVATQHRIRALATTQPATHVHLSSRIHPMAAVLALWDLGDAKERLRGRRTVVELWCREHPSATLIGCDPQRTPSLWRVPVTGADTDCSTALGPELALAPESLAPAAHAVLRTVRVATLPAVEIVSPGIVVLSVGANTTEVSI